MDNIGIIGYGFVGKAIKESLDRLKLIKEIQSWGTNQSSDSDSDPHQISVSIYDPVKLHVHFDNILNTNIVFIAVPTNYSEHLNNYDYSALHENLTRLSANSYGGLVVIKSTITPDEWYNLSKLYPTLRLTHNPEFLSARTATFDFLNQHHIVIGSNSIDDRLALANWYNNISIKWANAQFSLVSGAEAALIKLSCNSFYAYKISFFNMIYNLASDNDCDYKVVRKAMLHNGWINRQHTAVPGTDGKFGYGGGCLPKDSQSFSSLLSRMGRQREAELINNAIELNKLYRK